MMRKREQPYQRQIRTFDTLFSDTALSGSEGAQLVSISSIQLLAQQPRRYFSPQKMEQLEFSIKEHGILEPLLVRVLADGNYELVAGERRYRAALKVGLKEVPIIARQLSDEEALQLALVENLLREDLNPVEETEGILQLLACKLNSSVPEVVTLLYRMQNEAKGKVTRNVTGKEVTQQVQLVFEGLGLMSWESFIRNRLPLRNLPEDILEVLRQGKLEYTKAQVIARLKDQVQRMALLQAAMNEDLSVSQIKQRLKLLKEASDGRKSSQPVSLKNRVSAAMRHLKNSQLWEDPLKQQQLEKIVIELEALLFDSSKPES